MAKLFSSRHEDTKSLRTDNKIKSFVSLCLGGKFLSGLSGLGCNFSSLWLTYFLSLFSRFNDEQIVVVGHNSEHDRTNQAVYVDLILLV